MKKIASLLLTAVMAITLAGCGAPASNDNPEAGNSSGSQVGYPDEDGYAEGHLKDTMHTYFFDFTVNSAYTCSQYETYTPQEGNELVVAEITVKNTTSKNVTMYDSDFQMQWNDPAEDAYEFPITFYLESTDVLSKEMLPYEYTLASKESRTGLLVYEIPTGNTEVNISYLEEFDNDTSGSVYFVYFTPDHK